MARIQTLSDQARREWSAPSARALSVLRWLALPATREPLIVWIVTRGLFIGLTYFGITLFTGAGRFQGAHPSLLHDLLPAWGTRWDAAWYVEIAQRGYAWKKAATSPTAFFPLYPLAIHVLAYVTHRSLQACALVISNACFLGALLYLWRLTAWEVGREVAGRTVLYISIFPTALFFFAGYTESLFLLLTVAAFYHLRREDWIAAGTLTGLAGATRVTGILLLLPLAYEYGRSRGFSWRRLDRGALGLLLSPTGVLAFVFYLQRTVGDGLAFTHSQVGWQKVFTIQLWSGFIESARQILALQPAVSFFQAQNVINTGIGGFALVLSVLAARRLPLAYGLYLGAFWLVTLASPALANGYPVPLVSLARYVLILFPVFIYLGMVGWRRPLHDAYLLLSTGALAVLTLQFITNRWFV